MGFFSRLFKIGQAKANQLVDTLEKPELMLDQAIRDKEKNLKEAKESVQNVIAEERRLKAMLEKEKEQSSVWESKAEVAVKSGNDELAVKALQRGEEHSKNATDLEGQWTALSKQVEELKNVIRVSQDEIAELKRNKDLIIAQSKASEVKKNIFEAKAKIGSKSDTEDLISRMKAKAENQKFRAEAAQEMAEDLDGKDSLEKEFEVLGTEKSASQGVQDKLAALKNKLNK
ncbi:MAG: PspA/IM30 family protein [Candidatus Delongbacteria bacterium]|nr:PspA/IM30 family protein [Candidatus Delongbacteria bacterium]MBN2837058.1 PspA/IM30 family protein [Candidatus Delongbacteria bacterium]